MACRMAVRPLFRPALARRCLGISFPLRLDAHRPLSKTRRIVHFARNALTIDEDRGHARWHRSANARSEGGVFGHLYLLHEGENGGIAKFLRCEAFVGDVARRTLLVP